MKNEKTMVSVPYIAYEQDIAHKNTIIKIMGGIIFSLIIAIILTVWMFMSFISKYDYKNYDQNGDGINNINSGTQGDITNESNTTN